MQTFPGKIGFPDNPSGDVAAVITVADGRLEIHTGDTSIGRWPVTELQLELGVRGYLVSLDGEDLVLAPHDRYGFNEAIETAQEQASVQKGRRTLRKQARHAKRQAPIEQRVNPDMESSPAVPQVSASGTVDEEETRPRKKRFRRPKVAELEPQPRPDSPKPKPVPHIPGLEDPDKDALWATHRREEPTTFRERLNTRHGIRKIGLIALVAVVVLGYVAPAVVSMMLVIPAVTAVVLAGLGLLDASYTRFLPASMTEIRLMMIGIGLFGASLLVATFF